MSLEDEQLLQQSPPAQAVPFTSGHSGQGGSIPSLSHGEEPESFGTVDLFEPGWHGYATAAGPPRRRAGPVPMGPWLEIRRGALNPWSQIRGALGPWALGFQIRGAMGPGIMDQWTRGLRYEWLQAHGPMDTHRNTPGP